MIRKWINIFQSNLKTIINISRKEVHRPTFDEQYNKRETNLSLLFLDVDTYTGKLCNQYLDKCSEITISENQEIFKKELIQEGGSFICINLEILKIQNRHSKVMSFMKQFILIHLRLEIMEMSI